MSIKNQDLWDRFKKQGDREARGALIREYVPLVHYVVKRTAVRLPQTLDHDDVIAAGTLGLISAVEAFESDRGIEFSTFAVPRIRGAVLDEVRKHRWTSRTTQRRAAELEDVMQEAELTGERPDYAQLAERMNVPRERLGKLMASLRPVAFVPLDHAAAGCDEDGMFVSQVVGDDRVDDPQEQAELIEALEALDHALSSLPEAQRDLLIEYYFESHEQKDIARRMQVSRSRVSQIHSSALDTLRKRMQAAGAA
jgi:RNA polymerase sigma factor for flagellar operon FliA